MKAFKVVGCLLLEAVLLDIVGCGAGYTKKGPEASAADDTVKITNCTAVPDTILIPKGHTLSWTVDSSEKNVTYTINFTGRKPIALPTLTIPPKQSQTVTGDSVCALLGWVSSSKFCVYGYDVIKDGTKCKDPGVHVGSGGH